MTDNEQPEPAESTAPSRTACAQCGTALEDAATSRLCPRCLLQLGFESEVDADETGPYRPTFVAPLPEHLAPYFPQLEIEKRIGHGGMGVVYRAKQKPLDRQVALKILRPDLNSDPAFAERFLREAKVLAKLTHPNIVAIYDFGQTANLCYLIMEYVDGANLRHLERSEELTPAAALTIVPQICQALEFAHREGVVHRDIKPENILINTSGTVKIADFGLAKLVGQADDLGLTRAGQTMGTPHYMAPEQVERPSEVDHRADIYSLGVVLYEMLTGELPLGRFPSPSERAQIDARLDQVVLRALEKAPDLRYQRVTEVSTDIEALKDSAVKLSPSESRPRERSARDESAAGFTATLVSDRAYKFCASGLSVCGLIDVVIGLIVVLLSPFQPREFGYWAAFGLISVTSGTSAFLSGIMLRKQEYPICTKVGLALALVPYSCAGFVRAVFSIYLAALLFILRTKLSFTSPTWTESQTRATLLSYVNSSRFNLRSASARSMLSLRWLAKSVRNILPKRFLEASRLRGAVLALGSMIAWSLICLIAGTGLLDGWVRVFSPQQLHMADHSGENLAQPFGLERLDIIPNWSQIVAIPYVEDAIQCSSVNLVARTESVAQSSLLYLPDANMLQPVAHEIGPIHNIGATTLSREAIELWISTLVNFGRNSSVDLQSAECQQAIDEIVQLLEQYRDDRKLSVANNFVRNMLEPVAVGKRSLAGLLVGKSIHPLTNTNKTAQYIQGISQPQSEMYLSVASLMFGIWLLGILPLLRWFYVRVRSQVPAAEANRRLAVQAMLTATAINGLLLVLVYAGLRWLNSLPSDDWIAQGFFWYRASPMTSGLLLLAIGLNTIILMMIAIYFYKTRQLPFWSGSLSILTISVVATAGLLIQFPHWHWWPLLLPVWFSLLPIFLSRSIFRTMLVNGGVRE